MREWVGPEEPVRMITMDANCPERVQTVIELVKERMNVVSTASVPLSPVIGAHVGTGCLGICCCSASLFPALEGVAV